MWLDKLFMLSDGRYLLYSAKKRETGSTLEAFTKTKHLPLHRQLRNKNGIQTSCAAMVMLTTIYQFSSQTNVERRGKRRQRTSTEVKKEIIKVKISTYTDSRLICY